MEESAISNATLISNANAQSPAAFSSSATLLPLAEAASDRATPLTKPPCVCGCKCSSTSNRNMVCGVQTDTQDRDIPVNLPLWSLSLSPLSVSLKQAPATLSSQPELSNTKPFPLYSDVVQVVLKYLNPNELLSVIQLSKLWYQSFNTCQSLGLTSNVDAVRLSRMPSSSLIARHFSSATNLEKAIKLSHNQAYDGFTILPHLAMLLPNLTSLTVSIHDGPWDFPVPGAASWLPPLLKSIKIEINPTYLNVSSFIVAIGQLKQLQNLTLLGYYSFEPIDYSPLLLLEQLSQLSLLGSISEDGYLANSPSLVQFIRQTRISSLCLSDGVTTLSKLLSRAPADPVFTLMQSGCLTSIAGTINAEILQDLAQYPSVTQLSTSCFEIEEKEMKLLPSLPHVTHLKISRGTVYTMPCEDLVNFCQHFQQLRTLHITDLRFSSVDLNALLSHLPLLTDLQLAGTSTSSTLAPLSGYGLPNRLKRLSLSNFIVCASDIIAYIIPLHELEYLHLQDMCTSLIPDSTQQRLRNLPKLKQCTLLHGEMRARSFIPHMAERVTTSEEGDAYVADPSQKGTRDILFAPCTEETTKRRYESNIYEFAYPTYHSISSMKEYRNRSLEELRLEDEEIGLDFEKAKLLQGSPNADASSSSSTVATDIENDNILKSVIRSWKEQQVSTLRACVVNKRLSIEFCGKIVKEAWKDNHIEIVRVLRDHYVGTFTDFRNCMQASMWDGAFAEAFP